jgi:hypothetical protein
MFSAGRYLVVDDEQSELRLLVDALHGDGAPCIGIHWTGAPMNPAAFAGVRVLFSDLYLVKGANRKMQFNAIEAMLRTYVNPAKGGPFILVLWTTHDEDVTDLRAHLRARLEAELRPLAVLALDKKDYLGKPGSNDLAGAVRKKLAESPEIQALVGWEMDVLSAAGSTLAAITDLVPAGERDVEGFAKKLNGILSRLAVASVGKLNVAADRRGAIGAVLAPILADRIMNAPERPEAAGLWNQAITSVDQLPALDDAQIGRMNRMLHIALPAVEPVGATDWGAVLLIPDAERADGPMRDRFGFTYAELLSEAFSLKDDVHAKAQPVVVRTGAVCDHAQRKVGPLPFLLGVLMPTGSLSKSRKRLKSELESPMLVVDEAVGPVRLLVNARFQISMVAPPADWTPLFRIREQLLTMMNAHAAEYQTRPGVVKLPE